jgi:hypothetical protein
VEQNRNLSSESAAHLVREFAHRSGLDPAGRHPRRYLWTDTFAVCNFPELHLMTRDDSWRGLALRLVDQVHHPPEADSCGSAAVGTAASANDNSPLQADGTS